MNKNARSTRLPALLAAVGVGAALITGGALLQRSQAQGAALEAASAATLAAEPSATPSPQQRPSPTTAPTQPAITATPPTPTAAAATVTPVPPRPAEIDTGGYPTPAEAPGTAIPTPVEPVTIPPGVVNVLLMGSDKRPDDPGYRTDTMIVVSINTQENTVNMLSIPRDLMVYVPGWTMRKINTAFAHGEGSGFPGGGAGIMKETFLYNFGIRIDYYAFVELRAFQEIVDVMGGVEVPVDCAINGFILREPRRGPDDFSTYQEWVDYTDPELNPDNYMEYELPVGVHELDGYLSLWYARQRVGSSDFDRAFRQQQVLRAILRRARDLDYVNPVTITDLWRQYNDLVQTDMGLGNMLQFAPVARDLENYAISAYVLTPDLLVSWYDPTLDQQAFLLRPKAVDSLFALAMYPPAQNYVIQNTASVEVRNGTGVDRLDEVAADRLGLNGLNATPTGPADSTNYEESVIYDFTGREKTSQLRTLQRLLRVGDDDVIVQPDPNRAYDYVIILGENYRSCTRSINVPAPINEGELTGTPGATPSPQGTPGGNLASQPILTPEP